MVILFVLFGVMVFFTGILWGIFGIMLLIVGDMVGVIDIVFMLLMFGVVFAGFVFGDYCLLILDIMIFFLMGVCCYYIDYVVI